MRKNIFVALDFSNFDKALDVANSVKDHAAGIKITNELFSIIGKEGLQKISNFGLDIFLDLKLLDVPNTVKKTVASIDSLKTVKYLTVHTSGGYDMLKSANEAAKVLDSQGIKNAVINLRFIKPLDISTLETHINRSTSILVIEEGVAIGGVFHYILHEFKNSNKKLISKINTTINNTYLQIKKVSFVFYNSFWNPSHITTLPYHNRIIFRKFFG